MTSQTLTLLVFIATFFPVVIFTCSAILAVNQHSNQRGASADEFLLAGREMSLQNFANSSTGYLLQVSTTFYFIYWGYNYGLSNIWYMVSWGLGLLLFSRFAKQLTALRIKYTSLPQYISGTGQNSSIVRIAASIATILSFVGLFYVETSFVTDLITSAGGIDTSKPSIKEWWIVFVVIAGVTAAYSMIGGLRKVIANDEYQLAFSYFGLGTVFAFLADRAFNISFTGGVLICLFTATLYVVIMVADVHVFQSRIKLASLIASIILQILPILLNLELISNVGNLPSIAGLFKQVGEPWGWFTLLGFTLINLFWQFADSSVFQRIAAIRLSSDETTAENEIKRVIRSLAIVSPLTWGLGIILGVLIKLAAVTISESGSEFADLVSLLRTSALTGEVLPLIALIALIIGLVSITMSTVDVAVIAAIQTFSVDIKKPTTFKRWHAVLAGLGMLLLTLLVGYLHKDLGLANLYIIMAGFPSALVSLAPLTIARLTKQPVPAFFAILAIITGILGAMFGTFGPVEHYPANVKLVLPIFTGLMPSVFFTVVGVLYSKYINKKTM